MALELFAHPLSSYCQKALIAFYENDTPFIYRLLSPENPSAAQELARLWPLQRFPVLVDEGAPVMEATIIIEHLALRYPGPVKLVPPEPGEAQHVRFLDRFFDNYVMTPMQKIVADALRSTTDRDAYGVAQARRSLDAAYDWLETKLVEGQWAAGEGMTMADCAAAPSLFYADWVHGIGDSRPVLASYRRRLLQRPSVARAVDEARPYRALFPLGAPDRD